MPEYYNPHNYAVHLAGPDGRAVKIKARQKIMLPEFYDKYRSRGFIKKIGATDRPPPPPPAKTIQARIHIKNSTKALSTQAPVPVPTTHIRKSNVTKARKIATAVARAAAIAGPTAVTRKINNPKPIVGRTAAINANELLKSNLASGNYPISNNIGVGILSYNRSASLKRLVDSIIRNTDLRRTTVFISDDGSDDPATLAYLDGLAANQNFVIIRNQSRLGIAGNSNRLLRCLSRFENGLLLNDDVEVIASGWDNFYADAMHRTGMCHFIYRQPGVYGADAGEPIKINNTDCSRVMSKPHGAVLAFNRRLVDTIGFFDESYGLYGMEHIDWSQRAWELDSQAAGFFDVVGSDHYFILHADDSVVPNRSSHLTEAKKIFAARQAKKVPASDASRVPEIAYIIPFRNFERTESITTVINNVRAQRFPVVHIIMVEQDSATNIDLAPLQPVDYHLVTSDNPLFNKSKAFNFGVSKAPCDMIILHDADMMAQGYYTQAVASILARYEACHIGDTVIYTTQAAMVEVNRTGVVDITTACERVVGYYEGGSLACTKPAFWKVGAFNEDYWGYGCEDCDFYARLSGGALWKEDRSFDFLHLWHSRVGGWHIHHENNRRIERILKQKSIADRIKLQHDQLTRLGYPMKS